MKSHHTRRPSLSLEIRCGEEQKDLLSAELWGEGSTGIEELAYGLRAFFPGSRNTAELLQRFSPYHPHCETVHPRDWVEYVKSMWQPQLAGTRFFLVPQWRNDPTPPGRLRIQVNPGMAFGTGEHETTQLCLEALERHVQTGISVFDIGAGSGILAIAAKLLGAGQVSACDIDPEAVDIARENFLGAGVDASLFVGSLDAFRKDAADVIVSNISAGATQTLGGDLYRCLRPGGVALLSGFEPASAGSLICSLQKHGLIKIAEAQKGNWALLEFRRG